MKKRFRSEIVWLIYSDLRRYGATGAQSLWKVVLLYQGFWASCSYRIGHNLLKKSKIRLIRKLITSFFTIWMKWIQILTGISLPVGTTVGEGLYFAHFGGIIISSETIIGRNCNIGYQVGLGFGRSNGKFGHPIIGDRVFIGPGAKIFGPVKVGNDVAIGTNAVVTKDVPDRAVVIGIPARVKNYGGSFDYVYYDDMGTDPDRQMSLAISMQEQKDSVPSIK